MALLRFGAAPASGWRVGIEGELFSRRRCLRCLSFRAALANCWRFEVEGVFFFLDGCLGCLELTLKCGFISKMFDFWNVVKLLIRMENVWMFGIFGRGMFFS